MTLEEARRLGLPVRIITGLRLDKIAAVSEPCVEPALAMVMKSAPTKLLKKVDPNDHGEMPQALARLAAKGCDLTKIKAAHREAIIRKYNAGTLVTVMFEKTGETFLLKKGEEVWRFNVAGHREVEKSKGDPYEELRPENRPNGDDEEGEDEMHDFLREVDKVAARDGITKNQAMERVRKSSPDLYEQMQNRVPTAKAAPQRIEKSAAQLQFEDRVVEVAKSRGLLMTQAQDFCRKRYPDLWAQAYR